jgi:hypothetical protein
MILSLRLIECSRFKLISYFIFLVKNFQALEIRGIFSHYNGAAIDLGGNKNLEVAKDKTSLC